MKGRKNILTVVLAAALVLALAGCGGAAPSDASVTALQEEVPAIQDGETTVETEEQPEAEAVEMTQVTPAIEETADTDGSETAEDAAQAAETAETAETAEAAETAETPADPDVIPQGDGVVRLDLAEGTMADRILDSVRFE